MKSLQRNELAGYTRTGIARVRFLSGEFFQKVRGVFAFLVGLAIGLVTPASAKSPNKRTPIIAVKHAGETAQDGAAQRSSARGQASATVLARDDVVRVRHEPGDGESARVEIELEEERRYQVRRSDRTGTTIIHLE